MDWQGKTAFITGGVSGIGFGVARASLGRYERGMRMRIDVTPALKHEPFLIEDSRGLMIAFEPRKNG